MRLGTNSGRTESSSHSARWRMRLGTPSQRRIRTKPQTINYNRIVPQSRQTNPHRNLPHQNPLSCLKKPNCVFRLPFTPAGVKGRGGSGGQNSGEQAIQGNIVYLYFYKGYPLSSTKPIPPFPELFE
jgi:hypothetical protein